MSAIETGGIVSGEEDLATRRVHRKEMTITPEIVDFIESYRAAAHFHKYQPVRELRFQDESMPVFDISVKGTPLDSWASPNKPITDGVNAKVTAECYKPMVDQGILQSPLIGFHMYPSIKDWLYVHQPELWQKLDALLKEKHGFAGPPTQLALPTMPDALEDLAIDIGLTMHEQDYGEKPLAFWPPELLVNHKTVDKLAQKGIKVLILGRHQIEANEEAPLYYMHTQSGRLLFVLPYNNHLSHTMADEAKHLWADRLGDKIEAEQPNGVSTLIAVDGETGGHHHGPNSLGLLEFLVNEELPNRIQQGRISFERKIEYAKPAELKEGMTSWSCDHNGGRWTGDNDCYDDGIDDEIKQEKQSLYRDLYEQTLTITEELDSISETGTTLWQQEFMTWYIEQRYNIAAGEPITLNTIRKEYQESFRQLLVAMLGLQSCAFFFKGNFERGVARNARDYIRSRRGINDDQLAA